MLAELEGRKGLNERYVVAVVGVYVDADAVEEDVAKLEAAAKSLGVTLERSKGLSSRLSAELVKRSQSPEEVTASNEASGAAGTEASPGAPP